MEELRAPMEQFLTIDYPLISMHREDEERKQNWMLRTDANIVTPTINILYGHTYAELLSQHLLTIQARMGCFLTDYYSLISMHHEAEERKQKGC